MDVLSFFRRLYSLDTLDTRLTISSRTPEKDTKGNAQPVPEGSLSSDGGRVSRSGQTKPQNGASPSRWQTPEFYLYYVVFIVVVPQMFKAVIEVSQGTIPPRAQEASLTSLQNYIQIIPDMPLCFHLAGSLAVKLYVLRVNCELLDGLLTSQLNAGQL